MIGRVRRVMRRRGLVVLDWDCECDSIVYMDCLVGLSWYGLIGLGEFWISIVLCALHSVFTYVK